MIGMSENWRSAQDLFEEARWRYLRGMISEREFLESHKAMREEKSNGN